MLEKNYDSWNASITSEIVKIGKLFESIDSRFAHIESPISLNKIQEAISNFSCRLKSFNVAQAIQESLEFESIHYRYSYIAEAHRRTYEWIFTSKARSVDGTNRDVGFSTWLEHGSGLYWITGKPGETLSHYFESMKSDSCSGSGKSTLMKFLDKHPTAYELLRKWSSPHDLMTASFYFWNPGTIMQKSLQGLLQSLLLKILTHCPNLIPIVCPTRWMPEDAFGAVRRSSPWSLEELKNTIILVGAQKDIALKFYFLIDGLDEYEGDHYEVIEILQELSQSPNIKLCVSSRPWNQFHHTIGQTNSGSLQLHTLTKSDIELFARESIQKYRCSVRSNFQEPQYDDLVNEIVQRAQGVFLWVRLVIRSLRDGLMNDDQISLLRKRLEELPSDLEEFFAHILSSVDGVYRECMARTFLTALAVPEPLEMIHYCFLEAEDLEFGWKLPFSPLEDENLADRLDRTRWRLNGRYKGLLEPSIDNYSQPDRFKRVEFLHRTLRDFLTQPKIKTMLESHVPPDFDPHIAACGAYFAELKFAFKRLIPLNFVELLKYSRNAAEQSKNPLIEYKVIEHTECVWKSLWIPTHHEIFDFRHLALSVAIHVRWTAYLEHKIETYKESLDLEQMLVYACCWPISTHQTFSSFITHNFYVDNNRLLYKEADIVTDVSSRSLEVVNMLLEQGANPMESFRTISVFRYVLQHFLENWPTGRMNYVVGLAICATLVKYGANPNGHADVWTTLLYNGVDLSNQEFNALIEVFDLLLKHKIDPNSSHGGTSIWVSYMTLINYKANWQSEYEAPSEELMRHFLRRGANLRTLVESSWLREMLVRIEKVEERYLHLSIPRILTTFMIILQNGIDPNEKLQGGLSLWEEILQSMIFGRVNLKADTELSASMRGLLLCFLEYRADPCSERLHYLLDFHTQIHSSIFNKATSLVQAVKRELKDLRFRDIIPSAGSSLGEEFDNAYCNCVGEAHPNA